MSIAFITHDECLLHDMENDPVEVPDRIKVISQAASNSQVKDHIKRYAAPVVAKKHLYATHDKTYVKDLFEKSPKQGVVDIDDDTQLTPFTLQAARRAAGAGVKAVDFLLHGKFNRAFCNVRPPGHHAEKDAAMGFCFFNNIAVAATYALSKENIHRVAIVDFDVHHGNGTEDIFKENDNVLMLSSFQNPLYPWWEQDGTENNRMVHTELNEGDGTSALKKFFKEDWKQRLEKFKPDIIFISAGFDAHKDDLLGGLNFEAQDYHWMTEQVVKIANQVCQGRVIAMLEGGYNLEALKQCSVAHLSALAGLKCPKELVVEDKPPDPVMFSSKPKPKRNVGSEQQGPRRSGRKTKLPSYLHSAGYF